MGVKTSKSKKRRPARTDEQTAAVQARWNRRYALRAFEKLLDSKASIDSAIAVMLDVNYASLEDFVDVLMARTLTHPASQAALLVRLLRIIQLKEMPYPEYLKTPEWTRQAEIVKKEWDHRCALNTAHEGTLDAHHRTYERRGREYPNDVIPLCRECHGRFHDRAGQ